eukprot:SAG11_NODE_866_length_6832_cov_4.929303_3_plen_199_part_00
MLCVCVCVFVSYLSWYLPSMRCYVVVGHCILLSRTVKVVQFHVYHIGFINAFDESGFVRNHTRRDRTQLKSRDRHLYFWILGIQPQDSIRCLAVAACTSCLQGLMRKGKLGHNIIMYKTRYSRVCMCIWLAKSRINAKHVPQVPHNKFAQSYAIICTSSLRIGLAPYDSHTHCVEDHRSLALPFALPLVLQNFAAAAQ